eukprot:gene555-599_t
MVLDEDVEEPRLAEHGSASDPAGGGDHTRDRNSGPSGTYYQTQTAWMTQQQQQQQYLQHPKIAWSSNSDGGGGSEGPGAGTLTEIGGEAGRGGREVGEYDWSTGAVVVRGPRQVVPSSADPQLPFAPLLNLQRSVASCFDDAHTYFLDIPEVAAQVRRGAVLCREQLLESTKMLRKVEQTATSVLNLFPDLELAVEEGEPSLAAEFFNMVRQWVGELREMSAVNLHLHTESGISSALQLNDALETSRELLKSIQKLVAPQGGQEGDEARPLSQAQLLELFVNLFGQLQRGKLLSSAIGDDSRGSSFEDLLSAGLEGDGTRGGQGQGAAVTRLDSDTSSVEGGSARVLTDAMQAGCGSPERVGDRERIVRAAMAESPLMDVGDPTTYDHSADLFSAPMMSAPQSLGLGSEGVMGGSDSRSGSSKNGGGQSMKGGGRRGHGSDNSGEGVDATAVQVAHRPNQARNRLMEAFHKLKQVDLILEQLGVFWANTEVVLDVITKKGQHAEQFIGFAHKPKLLQRFRDRMGEYRRFWDGVRDMCQKYLAGVREPGQRLYGFLDNDYPSDSSGSGGHESAVVQSNVEGLERVGPRV